MTGQLTQKPENVVGVVGSSVTLICAGSVLQWEEYISDPNSPVILTSKERNYDDTKYDLITTPTDTYNLTIKSLALKDGGRYSCNPFRVPSSYAEAEVIVFKGKIICIVIDSGIVIGSVLV